MKSRIIGVILTILCSVGGIVATIDTGQVKKNLVIHTTATPQGATVEAIKRYWKNHNGWGEIPGYHVLIDTAGKPIMLQPLNKIAYGARGYNTVSIHISYIGGIDKNGKPKDTRTPAQIRTLWLLVSAIKQKIPGIETMGHRDLPNVKKACPSFDAKAEFQNLKGV